MPFDNHDFFMKRALTLAEMGRGSVSPNPMVGCVIVHEEKIIGEGWHQLYGEAHAEVNAINDIKDKALLAQSTCYVTLEPCAHHGRTPPCADLLTEKRLKKVVIGCSDSNPLVGGKGIEKLKSAGIEVVLGVLEHECRALNHRFFTYMEKKRPYVILKWAQTNDGFIARENFDSKWISNAESRTLVHQWRAEEDAILVGTNTAKFDDPALNVRDWSGTDPVRLVVDRSLKLGSKLKLYDRSQSTVVYNAQVDSTEDNLEFVKTDFTDLVSWILQDLYARKVQSVIVEGGSNVINQFIDSEFWDEARVFSSDKRFEKGIAAPVVDKPFTEQYLILNDKLNIYYNG